MKKHFLALCGLAFLLPLQLQAADLANGKALNKNCALCHGLYGQGASGKLSPRLAGMPQEYLIKALGDYRAGKRQNYMMLKTAALDKMTDKDIEDVSAYLASIDLSKDPKFDVVQYGGDVKEGKSLFKGDCKTCHGRDGFGKPKKGAPPLAAQHNEYLFQSIKMFQAKMRMHDNDPEDETFDDFSDTDLTNITAYIATLDNARIDASGKTKFIPPDLVARRAIVKPTVPTSPTKPVVAATELAKADTKAEKIESQGGLQITDIKQTVAKMELEKGVSIDDAVTAMISKATDLNMKLVGQQEVSKELEARGVEMPHLAIYQFCDPMDARTMVMSNPIFASYMPCRISVVEDKDKKVWLMMLNLDMLINSELLDTKVLDTAVRVNQAMLEIMVAGATGDF
ncbi:MAG TPA: c-type cytochrome [Thiothrix sp.]|nr:c-type cytochrome [Thiothrix sp.]